MKREIITIDQTKCDGCGDCVPGCPEGALQIIDGRARLVGDLFCDGLGACIGTCQKGAISVEERDAEPYDERRVMEEMIVKGGTNVIAAHLEHLKAHGEEEYLQQALVYLKEKGIESPINDVQGNQSSEHEGCGCAGSVLMDFRKNGNDVEQGESTGQQKSELTQWPIQLHLVTPLAPCYRDSDLLLAADCTAFAIGAFHPAFMRGKSIAIACPKLDSGIDRYVEKLKSMIELANINTITVVIMEVPCCGGLVSIVNQALDKASRDVPVTKIVIGVRGDVLGER
ncbi:4Fe-4S dicluster domain-containing protein [Prosthecochloris sp.]|uniref:ATP-binding protein n=1 Tax=Prosthecochloris sp. TaxID=290513 RepID=UPI0025CF0846|nr:4Fe-4S dicluster domain-containing protein [Prosthecochloris sp.]